jgi:hypothetical protein
MTIKEEMGLFFEKSIFSDIDLKISFNALIGLYYYHFKQYSTKKEFKNNSKTLKMEYLIKKCIKEFPYLKGLSCYGGLK